MTAAAMADYPIYDADHHYYEPPEAFLRYLPKKFKADFQYAEINGRTKLIVGGVLSDYIPNPTFNVVAGPGSQEKWYRAENPDGLTLREFAGEPVPSQPAFHSGRAHLELMDREGIHGAIVLPTMASIIEERLGDKPETVQALMHSLNLWVADEYGFGNGRQFPAGAINLSDVDVACKELDFLLEAGARCVLIRPAPVAGLRGSRSHGFKEFDPFWARINESKTFVIHHVSDSGYNRIYQWWTAGGQGEFRPFEKDPFGEILDWMGRPISDSLAALICHGVFDRFPDVRVAVLENGSSWLEPLLRRMETTYKKMPKNFARDPVETFRKHVFLAPFYEDPVDKVIDLLGPNRVLFGSDWPHPEGLAHPRDFFKDIEGISPEHQKMVMSTNLKGLLEGVRD
ncbi:MAG: amidohydrolase family protein [Rhodocyclaceae bacterium]|jgi:predicted TIM-barrel fold metal-dependent hydrolase|nr:amidohydrolase family protein [Rhodocyclaceae bacterium]